MSVEKGRGCDTEPAGNVPPNAHRGHAARGSNHSKGRPLKVTIDSNEPLNDAIRVIGALYNVTLTPSSQSTGVPDNNGGKSRASARSNGKPATPTRKQPRRVPAQEPMRGPAPVTRRKSTPKAADPGEIRAWAKANGHSVNDRGPLSSAVRSAFAGAQRA